MAIFFMTGGLYTFVLEGVGRKMCVLTNKKTLKEGKGCAEIVKWGFKRKLPLSNTLWCANAIDEN